MRISVNKKEFFDRVFENLPQYSETEKEDIKEYYEELINDGIEAGIGEEEVISKLETPEKIAESLKKEIDSKTLNNVLTQGNNIENVTSDDYISSQNISTVIICARDRELRVEQSLDGKVHVCCKIEDMDEIVCYEKDGIFYFDQRNKKNIRFLFRFNYVKTEPAIIIKLPKDLVRTELTTTNAGIYIENCSLSQYLKAETTNVGILCKGVFGNRIDLTTTNAGIKCQNVNADNLYINTTNGGIKLKDVEATEAIKAETTNSSIKIEKINADIVDLESSNGSVKGIMSGSILDYRISSKTSNGQNSLPTKFQADKEGLKILKIRTSNAKIDVEFEK